MASGTPIMPPTARAKEPVEGEEEAGRELHLGEFQNVYSLTLSETKEIISTVFAHRKGQGKFKVPDNAVISKTQAYLDVFSRFKQREAVTQVERMLSEQKDLLPFERAQLGTLCCETAEEAKTLIPSLADKKSDDDLQLLLNEITKLRNFLV